MNEKANNKLLLNKYSNQEFYDFLKKEGLILFETIVGSQAYGTNTPESDIDKKFVYILPEEFIYGINYIPQITINADYVGYEIRRFIELIETNNPTLLELLNSPKDCIQSKHPIFDVILDRRDEFVTKICKDSFGGYARDQISKAKGQDKMMNWEKDKVTRKIPLDFCRVIVGNGSRKMKGWLKSNKMDQKLSGAVKIPNMKGMHALYYDIVADACFSKYVPKEEREKVKAALRAGNSKMGHGYKGIMKEDLSSSEIRMSSIPKKENNKIVCYFHYDKEAYVNHCKDFNKYQKWLKNRNEARWVDVEGHGQKIDGKNMMHCIRLIDVASEIAQGKGIVIRRPNAKYLLSIRKGKVDLESLITMAKLKIAQMDIWFKDADLPDSVDRELANQLLIQIRKEVYGNRS